MSYQIRFTKGADQDIDDILDFIAQDSVENAIKFIDNLETRIEKVLSTFPAGGIRYKTARYFAFDNYIVVYDIDEKVKMVSILLITEGHRQWKTVLERRGRL